MVADCSDHPNVLGLIGVCGGIDNAARSPAEALYVVLQDGSKSLKQALLDSRLLEHDPARARRVGRGSAMEDAQLLRHAIECANAMEYLSSRQVHTPDYSYNEPQ